jgi:hypothetical protein
MTPHEVEIRHLNCAFDLLVKTGAIMHNAETPEAQNIWWNISGQMHKLKHHINKLADDAGIDPERPDLNPAES